ncbi:MAG: radical SAM family heme chaperone HemW [Victivallales bacterium]|nr:radical SAM family heme chaperone HemW [Victivallales bacterium]
MKDINDIKHLYIHVPFCSKKCDYCAFYSIPTDSESLINLFLKHLEIEIIRKKHLCGNLQSIYFGGGTPTLLTAEKLEKLFLLISENFVIDPKAEISVESNPASLTEKKIKLISSFSNRISLGIQSFNPALRTTLGRNGDPDCIDNIIESLSRNNLTNISADLIYGIPGQTLSDFQKDLTRVLQLPLSHISLYSLTFEEGTEINKKLNCDKKEFEVLAAEMWHTAGNFLNCKGMKRYEVSNYAKCGYECKHNLNTWLGGNYLGLGPTASSYYNEIRFTNPVLYPWLKGKAPEEDIISAYERLIEIFIMGLRTTHPWSVNIKVPGPALMTSDYMNKKLSLDEKKWQKLLNKLNYLKKNNLLYIIRKNNCFLIYSTEKGRLFWDSLALEIMETV